MAFVPKRPLKWRLIAGAGRVLNATLHLLTLPLGRKRQSIFLSTVLEHLDHIHVVDLPDGQHLQFWAPGYKPAFRGISLFTKQPEIKGWIDGFQPGDVFWDIGANVGAYTLYASSKPGVRVVCFEPEASNYSVLVRNISLNRCFDRVTCYCLALSDKMSFSTLSSFHAVIGGSKHAFGDTASSWEQPDMEVVQQQGMLALSADELVQKFDFPQPNHVKLDVDGIEELILSGARQVLADPRCRSVHMETQRHKSQEADASRLLLEECGYTCTTVHGVNEIWTKAQK